MLEELKYILQGALRTKVDVEKELGYHLRSTLVDVLFNMIKKIKKY